MSDLNNVATSLVDYWQGINEKDSTVNISQILPEKVFNQLNTYISQLNAVNDEMDVTSVISYCEDVVNQLADAISCAEYALSEAEGLQ
tara:strand:+ start:175 stop:438 length:264 start_codon:yes stop_codon:yes gene_type:complete